VLDEMRLGLGIGLGQESLLRSMGRGQGSAGTSEERPLKEGKYATTLKRDSSLVN